MEEAVSVIFMCLAILAIPGSCAYHAKRSVDLERIHPEDIRWAEEVCRENGGIRYITHGGDGVTCSATRTVIHSNKRVTIMKYDVEERRGEEQ